MIVTSELMPFRPAAMRSKAAWINLCSSSPVVLKMTSADAEATADDLAFEYRPSCLALRQLRSGRRAPAMAC